MNETTQPAVAGPVEPSVRRMVAITIAVLDGATVEATGKEFGICRERVRQIVRNTVSKTYQRWPDRTWSAGQHIDELRANGDARNAVIALLAEPVESPVRPYVWMTRYSAHSLTLGGNNKGAAPVHGKPSNTAKIPLYDQATLDAAVAAERERCAKLVEQCLAEGSPMLHNLAAEFRGA